MKIMFSPVGKSDVNANAGAESEGSVAHLVRYLQPDELFLYISDEIETILKDSSFIIEIQKLQPKMEIKKSAQTDIANVNEFDGFYDFINLNIGLIEKDYPDAQIILNESSGTPAMKEAIHTIHALSKYNNKNILSYQVSDPAHAEDKKYRIIESKTSNLFKEYDRLLYIKYIESGQYIPALEVLENYKNGDRLFENDVNKRNILSKIKSSIQKLTPLPNLDSYKFIAKQDKIPISSFLLLEWNKKQNNSVNVLIKTKDITEYILEDYISVRGVLLDFDYDGSGTRINKDNQMSKKLLEYLNSKYNGKFKNYQLGINIYYDILKYLNVPQDILNNVKNIMLQSKNRNKVAHSLDELDLNAIEKLEINFDSLKNLVLKIYQVNITGYWENVNKQLLD